MQGLLAGGGAPKSHHYGDIPELWPLWDEVLGQGFGSRCNHSQNAAWSQGGAANGAWEGSKQRWELW